MQGLGSGVAHPGGFGRYKHITSAVRRRNVAIGAGLSTFVASVYYYTYSKMATNELTSLAAELDEVRAAREAAGSGAVAAVRSGAAAAGESGAARPGTLQ